MQRPPRKKTAFLSGNHVNTAYTRLLLGFRLQLLCLSGTKSTSSRTHLGQVPQLRPHPPQLVQDAVVEGFLLLAAVAQLPKVVEIQAGPVLREGLGTVALDLPARTSADKGWIKNSALTCLLQPLDWSNFHNQITLNEVLLKGVWQVPEAAQNLSRSWLQL